MWWKTTQLYEVCNDATVLSYLFCFSVYVNESIRSGRLRSSSRYHSSLVFRWPRQLKNLPCFLVNVADRSGPLSNGEATGEPRVAGGAGGEVEAGGAAEAREGGCAAEARSWRRAGYSATVPCFCYATRSLLVVLLEWGRFQIMQIFNYLIHE
jgi:hypothetical protein